MFIIETLYSCIIKYTKDKLKHAYKSHNILTNEIANTLFLMQRIITNLNKH